MMTIRCNVILIPGDELNAKAIQASKQFEQLGTIFTLENGAFYPHISVYMLSLQIDDLVHAQALLAQVAASTPNFDLTATNFFQQRGYFDAEYQKTEQLLRLQKEVVGALNPLRQGMLKNYQARLADAKGLELENLHNYGWSAVGELFRPHLTLTRFTSEQPSPEKLLPAVADFSGRFPKLGLFEIGENGTCVRMLATFDFD